MDGWRLVEFFSKMIFLYFVELILEDRELYDKVEENGKEVIECFMESGIVL